MSNQPHGAVVTGDFGRVNQTLQGTEQFNGLNPTVASRALLVFIGYYLGARLGFALTFSPHPVSVMWPPNSILMAALLLTPSRSWWFLILAAFPAHLAAEMQSGVPWTMVLSWFISNSCEALIGASATRFLVGLSRFDRLRDVIVLIFCAVLLGPFLSSFLDSGFVILNHWSTRTYEEVWRMRFTSNVFSALTIMPLIIAWGTHQFLRMRSWRWIEAGLLFCGLVAVSLAVFFYQHDGSSTLPILLYAPLPFLLWAAVRFELLGTSSAIFAVALLAIWSSVHGRGPFTANTPEQNALSIQIFFSVIASMLMLLAASITERRHAEERFAKAFLAGPEAMIISRVKDGHIIEVNERCEKMLGRQRSEIIGHMMYDMGIHGPGADRRRLTSDAHSGNNGLQEIELSLRAKSGELRHTQISAVASEIAGEQCLIIIIRDITDRKRAEEAQQNLAHVSRLAVVGELTAMIAHEINQPLGAILSNAEAAEILLESKNPPLDEIRLILQDIRKDDLRADEAIRRIRALLRKREMQMQLMDLNEAIVDGLRLVAGDALRRHVRIRRHLTEGLPHVLADRVHIQQVLLNLVVNGMDAMNSTPESERLLTIATRFEGDSHIAVSIVDHGHGVAPEKIPRLFDSFYTTKKDGMGLGLSIARSILEAHRGRIWAENNADKGATFYFTLPCVAEM